MHLVALLQAAQDGDGRLDARLLDQHLLETPLERRVLLDVLAVFVERGSADAMKLATGKRGLEHVAGVHRAFGLAGADQHVDLVDEDDRAAFILGELFQNGFQPFLEFAAILAPARSDARSSTSSRLFFSVSGTSPLTMRCARPSTIAVLPTPGSPISTGLFLVRRCRIWMQRRISSSRPITGSSLPWRARSVRSSVYLVSAWRCDSSACPCTVSPPRTSSIAFSNAALVTPACFKRRPASPLSPAAASRKSSEAMYWSPRFCASLSATLRSVVRSRPIITSPGVPSTLARRASASASPFFRALVLPPALAMRPAIPGSFSSALSKCGGSMYWLSLPKAALCASASASCSLVVNLSNRISLIL